MPNNATNSPGHSPSKLRARLTLGLIALCFGTPVFLALLFQSPLLNYRPAPTKNLGELISPVVALPELDKDSNASLVTTQSAAVTNADAQWTMLYFPPTACGNCVEQTSMLAHIRVAMGRELGRVKLELISPSAFALPPEANFTVRRSDAKKHAALLQSLGLTEGGVVLLDPLRNAMMRYPANFDGSKIRKDLARLLKASQLGKKQSSGVIG